jgi:hypothetical protein
MTTKSTKVPIINDKVVLNAISDINSILHTNTHMVNIPEGENKPVTKLPTRLCDGKNEKELNAGMDIFFKIFNKYKNKERGGLKVNGNNTVGDRKRRKEKITPSLPPPQPSCYHSGSSNSSGSSGNSIQNPIQRASSLSSTNVYNKPETLTPTVHQYRQEYMSSSSSSNSDSNEDDDSEYSNGIKQQQEVHFMDVTKTKSSYHERLLHKRKLSHNDEYTDYTDSTENKDDDEDTDGDNDDADDTNDDSSYNGEEDDDDRNNTDDDDVDDIMRKFTPNLSQSKPFTMDGSVVKSIISKTGYDQSIVNSDNGVMKKTVIHYDPLTTIRGLVPGLYKLRETILDCMRKYNIFLLRL